MRSLLYQLQVEELLNFGALTAMSQVPPLQKE